MRRTSLVHAKAHLSELVDEAEHNKRPVVILRHGRPAAAIVPLDLVPGAVARAPRRMTAAAARALMDRLVSNAPETAMSLEQALGRDRLEPSR